MSSTETHCGKCNKVCMPGFKCVNGACTCPGDKIVCNAGGEPSCVDDASACATCLPPEPVSEASCCCEFACLLVPAVEQYRIFQHTASQNASAAECHTLHAVCWMRHWAGGWSLLGPALRRRAPGTAFLCTHQAPSSHCTTICTACPTQHESFETDTLTCMLPRRPLCCQLPPLLYPDMVCLHTVLWDQRLNMTWD